MVKEKELSIFSKAEVKHGGCLGPKSKVCSNSAAGGNSMGVNPLLARAPMTLHPPEMLTVSPHWGQESILNAIRRPPPAPTFTALHASYTFLHRCDLLSLLGSVL